MTIFRERYYEALDDLRTAGELLIRAMDTDRYEQAAIFYEKALDRARITLSMYQDDESPTANLRPDLIEDLNGNLHRE
jgi:hypothetical protein